MTTQPYTSADFDNDVAKERQFMELGVEQTRSPRRSSYIHEPTGRESTMEQLADISRENVESSQARINYYE